MYVICAFLCPETDVIQAQVGLIGKSNHPLVKSILNAC